MKQLNIVYFKIFLFILLKKVKNKILNGKYITMLDNRLVYFTFIPP